MGFQPLRTTISQIPRAISRATTFGHAALTIRRSRSGSADARDLKGVETRQAGSKGVRRGRLRAKQTHDA